MADKTWVCYEDGIEQVFSLPDLQAYFNKTPELDEQKKSGTDFASWLEEMEHMQILIQEE